MFTDLVRDANGRATMKVMYNGKELHAILGPKYKTVLLWSTPLGAGGGGGAAVAAARRAPGAAPRAGAAPGRSRSIPRRA